VWPLVCFQSFSLGLSPSEHTQASSLSPSVLVPNNCVEHRSHCSITKGNAIIPTPSQFRYKRSTTLDLTPFTSSTALLTISKNRVQYIQKGV
jgi:hypothetical protein